MNVNNPIVIVVLQSFKRKSLTNVAHVSGTMMKHWLSSYRGFSKAVIKLAIIFIRFHVIS